MAINPEARASATAAKKRELKSAISQEKSEETAATVTECLSDLALTGIQWIRTREGMSTLVINGNLESIDKTTPQILGAHLRSTLKKHYDCSILSLAAADIAYAVAQSKPVKTYIRVAECSNEIFIDLCNEAKQIVRITPIGWTIIPAKACPVLFIRPSYAQALPEPLQGAGDRVSRFRDLLSLDDRATWLKVLGFLLGALRHQGSHFVLPLMGGAGMGKSTLGRFIAKTVDPMTPLIQQLRKKPDDMLLVATKRWVTCFDECDALNGEQAATIAGLATGTGAQGRALYTDHALATISACRPLILSGHGNLIREERILSRSLPVTITSRTSALSDSELDRKFDEIAPEVLGALCTLAVGGLRFQGEPFATADAVRMLEPSQWIEKCLQAGGLIRPGEFVGLIRADQDALSVRSATPSVPTSWCLTPALLSLAEKGYRGLASDLLCALGQCKGADVSAPGWPADAPALGKQLSAHAAEIQASGIVLGMKQTKNGTEYTLSRSTASQTKQVDEIAPDALAKMRADYSALSAVRPTASVVFSHHDGCCTLWGPLVADAAAQIGRETGEKAHLDLSAEEFASLNGLDSEVMFLEAS